MTDWDRAIKWIVGTKRGCREVAWLVSDAGEPLGFAVESVGWVWLMVACSSWRKLSRVEQMIRVVGEVWWRRIKLMKEVQGSGARAKGEDGRGMMSFSILLYDGL